MNKLKKKNKLFKNKKIRKRSNSQDIDQKNSTQEMEGWGCTCKKSRCNKNYCECLKRGVSCTEACKCLDCANGKCSGHEDPKPPKALSLLVPEEFVESVLSKREASEDWSDDDTYETYTEIGRKFLNYSLGDEFHPKPTCMDYTLF